MQGLSVNTVGLFALSCAANLAGACLIPASNGLTNWPFTVGIALCYCVGIWSLSRLFVSGANLSLLIPLMSVVIPLLSIAVGVFVYKETPSMLRVGMISVACCMVAVASRV